MIFYFKTTWLLILVQEDLLIQIGFFPQEGRLILFGIHRALFRCKGPFLSDLPLSFREFVLIQDTICPVSLQILVLCEETCRLFFQHWRFFSLVWYFQKKIPKKNLQISSISQNWLLSWSWVLIFYLKKQEKLSTLWWIFFLKNSGGDGETRGGRGERIWVRERAEEWGGFVCEKIFREWEMVDKGGAHLRAKERRSVRGERNAHVCDWVWGSIQRECGGAEEKLLGYIWKPSVTHRHHPDSRALLDRVEICRRRSRISGGCFEREEFRGERVKRKLLGWI